MELMQGKGLDREGGAGDSGGPRAGLRWSMAASHCGYPLWPQVPLPQPQPLWLHTDLLSQLLIPPLGFAGGAALLGGWSQE